MEGDGFVAGGEAADLLGAVDEFAAGVAFDGVGDGAAEEGVQDVEVGVVVEEGFASVGFQGDDLAVLVQDLVDDGDAGGELGGLAFDGEGLVEGDVLVGDGESEDAGVARPRRQESCSSAWASSKARASSREYSAATMSRAAYQRSAPLPVLVTPRFSSASRSGWGSRGRRG